MSEPAEQADSVQRLVPGLWHWTIHDDRIDFRSEAYAIRTEGGVCLIDPLPLARAALQSLGPIESMVLTGAFHQRSAWSYRAMTGARVYAPRGAAPMDHEPDERYTDGDRLPGGLTAELRTGPTNPHMVLRRQSDGLSVLFCGDMLIRDAGGPFRLASEEHHDDLRQTHIAVGELLRVACDALCPAHGAPLLEGGTDAIREAQGMMD